MRLNQLFLLCFLLISTFSKAQIPGPCGQAGDVPPGCFLCDSVYTGSTSGFTPGLTPPGFCGTVENNQWISVQAADSNGLIQVESFNCQNGQGLGMILVDQNLNAVSTCFSSGGFSIPGLISARGLTPGEVYWLMIDGFAGDVCDFSLELTGFALTVDTVRAEIRPDSPNPPCIGQTVCYSVDTSFLEKVNQYQYAWEVPDKGSLVSGTDTTDSRICVRWDSAGVDTLSLRYWSDCNGFDTMIYYMVDVLQPVTIVLPDVELCPFDFPFVLHGLTFPLPGNYSFVMPGSSPGCDTTFMLTLIELPNTTTVLDTTLCPGNCLELMGQTLCDAGSYEFTLGTPAANGCDSVMVVNLDFASSNLATIAQPDTFFCQSGCQILQSSLSGPYVFTWTTTNGLIQSGANTLMPEVCLPGTYTLEVTDTLTGELCNQDVIVPGAIEGPDMVVLSGPAELCAGDTGLLVVNSDPKVAEYLWDFPTQSFSGTSPEQGFVLNTAGVYTVCVRAANICDTTQRACLAITVKDPPLASFELDPVGCPGEPVFLTYTGNAPPSANFNWNFGGATTIVGTGSGPYELYYDDPGTYSVELVVEADGCISDRVGEVVEIEPILQAPILSCASLLNSIEFSWDPVPGAISYELELDGIFVGFSQNTTFFIDNLDPGTAVTLRVTPQGDGPCLSQTVSLTCQTQDCPPVQLQVIAPQVVCADESPLFLEVNIQGGMGGGTGSWSGPGVQPDGQFFPDLAGTGSHQLLYTYIEGDCPYEIFWTIDVLPLPDLSAVELLDPVFFSTSDGRIDLQPQGNGPFQVNWSNGQTGNPLEQLAPGQYCATVTDDRGCQVQDCFFLESGTYKLTPFHIICAGESVNLNVRPSSGASFSWSPATGLSCTDCPNPEASPTQPTIYTLTVQTDDGRGASTNVWVLVLPSFICRLAKEGAWTQQELIDTYFSDDVRQLPESSPDTELMIFPNPASRHVFFRAPGTILEVRLYDLAGRELERLQKSTNLPSDPWSLDITTWPSGLYLAKVRVGEQWMVGRFVVE